MIDILFCGYNLFCHFKTLNDAMNGPKYPPNVAELCQYFEDQKAKLPDYCKWQIEVKPPRRRSEF